MTRRTKIRTADGREILRPELPTVDEMRARHGGGLTAGHDALIVALADIVLDEYEAERDAAQAPPPMPDKEPPKTD